MTTVAIKAWKTRLTALVCIDRCNVLKKKTCAKPVCGIGNIDLATTWALLERNKDGNIPSARR
jgi:hypothetical protein